MEREFVRVGIFWAIPDEEEGGWKFEAYQKSYPFSAAKQLANEAGLIEYPFLHFDAWEGKDAPYDLYPRGRIAYDVECGVHRIFVDKCLDLGDVDELFDFYDIEDATVHPDESYVSMFAKRKRGVPSPKLEFGILRGRDKIGENLIEMTSGETRVLVELGKALDGGEELDDMEKKVLSTKYDAVIVSHYHADHAGLIGQKRDCPVFVGAGARRILDTMSAYDGRTLGDNIKTYRDGQPMWVGNIKITPYLCDHSAYDSYMLLFEAGGRSVLYTGDFRFHGRKNGEKLLEKLPKHVDTLITEGTNVGADKPCFSERELEMHAVELMKSTDKPIFVLQSASNIDRIVSFYRAAKRVGRVFYEDVYTAYIAAAAGGSIPRPDFFKDVYAFTPRRVTGRRREMLLEIKNRRGMARIAKGEPYVMLVRPSMADYLKKLAQRADISGGILIYSMWSGYREQPSVKQFSDTARELGLTEHTLHTSGHASAEDIEKLKQHVHADETVIVHTSKPQQ